MKARNGLPAEMEARRNVTTRYLVDAHVIDVSGRSGRWNVSVDAIPLDASFASTADAWTAGVVEADRRDRAGGEVHERIRPG